MLERHSHLIRDLARLSRLDLGPDVEAPKNSATQVAGDVEVFLGDVLDPERERARLEKDRDKLSQQLEGGKKKLANEKFVSRAPAEVVETERKRVADLESQLASITKNLQALNG